MEFSLHIQTRIKDWEIIKELELMGYDSVWVPDTQMMWSDCYSTMALAAQNTDKIKIGTGVAIAGTRNRPNHGSRHLISECVSPREGLLRNWHWTHGNASYGTRSFASHRVS